MRVLRKSVAVLLVGALLAAPSLSAAGARPVPRGESRTNFRDAPPFLETLGNLLKGAWSKEGSSLPAAP
jgi:hypothetical protein